MKARIKSVIRETAECKSFRFAASEQDRSPKFGYKAGQWTYVTLPTLTAADERGPRRQFTLSSAPSEPELQLTTMITESGYKQTLDTYTGGEEIEIGVPLGKFCLEKEEMQPKLFLAGGIGITPFRSMLRTIIDRKLAIDVNLIYSVRSNEQMIFAKEMLEFDSQPNINVGVCVTGEKFAGSNALVTRAGRIDATKITQFCPDWKNRQVWVCGPGAMVEAVMKICVKMGVEERNLKSEELVGY